MTTSLILTLAIAPLLGAALGQTPPLALRVSMISLPVKDPDRSIRFYGGTLGLPMIGKPGEVTLFRAGEITLVLNQPAALAAKSAIAGSVEIIFPVESVTAAHNDFAQRGCHFTAAPHEVSPGMWAATFTDPDGHQLTLFGQK